jgi:hypothetical protein
MDKKHLARRLATSGRTLCVACIVLPCLAFALGVAAVYFPVPVLALTIAACGLGWISFYRLLSAPEIRDLHGRIATVVSFGSLSLAHAFGSGITVAGPGNYDLVAMTLSFAFGLISALIYRRHQRELSSMQASAA